MKGIIPRRVLTGDGRISIRIDKDTRSVIKMWAWSEGISIAQAIQGIFVEKKVSNNWL